MSWSNPSKTVCRKPRACTIVCTEFKYAALGPKSFGRFRSQKEEKWRWLQSDPKPTLYLVLTLLCCPEAHCLSSRDWEQLSNSSMKVIYMQERNIPVPVLWSKRRELLTSILWALVCQLCKEAPNSVLAPRILNTWQSATSCGAEILLLIWKAAS